MHCEIVTQPITDLEGLMDRVRSDSDGAVILFTGVVRNHDAGRSVESLHYEVYMEMARAKLLDICRDVGADEDVGDMAVVHRVGDLTVGDVSVAIAVAAPHRDAAYRASRTIIERLKQEVPIWKRERYTDGEEKWLGGASPGTPNTPIA